MPGGPAFRGPAAKPPDKGSFPLDKRGQCTKALEEYMKCMKECQSQHYKCKALSKKYLQCRMHNNLMANEDLNQLGFNDEDDYSFGDSATKYGTVARNQARGFYGGLSDVRVQKDFRKKDD